MTEEAQSSSPAPAPAPRVNDCAACRATGTLTLGSLGAFLLYERAQLPVGHRNRVFLATGGAGGPRMDDEIFATFKLLLIGDSGTGKSSLLVRFTDDRFEPEQAATIGVDFKVKILSVARKNVKLTIWDTAGQERFRTLTSSYYRGAHGVIFVYDVTNRESFANLELWFNELDTYATSKDIVKMVIGNKIDNEDGRVVDRKEGEQIARKHSTLFIEASAKTRLGVEQAFEELVQKIIDTPSLYQKGGASSATKSTVKLSPAQDEPAPSEGGCAC